MFEDLFGELETSLTDIVESEIFQGIIYVIAAYIVLIWLATAFWAYRDMRLRTTSAITPYVAALAIILFTPVFFLFGWILYRIVRPKETIAEVNERVLAEEAMLAEVATHAQCANCERPVHEDWIICPSCRNRLRRVCPNCEHLIELDWTLCAWCGKDFERAEAAGTTPFMPTARPASLPPPTAPRPAPPAPPPPQARPTAPPPQNQKQSQAQSQAQNAAQYQAQNRAQNPAPPTQPQRGSSPPPQSSGTASSSSSQAPGGAKPPTGV